MGITNTVKFVTFTAKLFLLCISQQFILFKLNRTLSLLLQNQAMEIQQIKKENNQLRRLVQNLLRTSQEPDIGFDMTQNPSGNTCRWNINEAHFSSYMK